MTPPRLHNRFDSLRAFNAGRDAERLALKWNAMRASPFAYFRGTAHLFWVDLARRPRALPESPLVWACGDLHLENFGSFRGDNGLAYFDLNDFDEAAQAPMLWELARFVTGLYVAAPVLGLSRTDTRSLAKFFLASHRAAMLDGKARWIERATAEGPVRRMLRDVKHRTNAELLNRRTVMVRGRRRLLVDGRHALPATSAQRAMLKDWCTRLEAPSDWPHFFQMQDVARRIAGTGSLGVERFIILVRGRDADGNVLLDAKQAVPSSLAAVLPVPQRQWRSEAERVVTVQHRMQAISPALLRALRLARSSVVLRELQPVEDRLVLASIQGQTRHLHSAIRSMGHIVAWAQLRATGRDGSATVDTLRAFARTPGWRAALLSYAERYVRQVEEEYRQFVVAHEHGVLA